MNAIHRRATLRGIALGALVLLARCAGMTVSQVATWALTVGNAAVKFTALLPAGTTVPPVIVSGLQTLQSLAGQLASASGTQTGAIASQLITAASEVLPVAAQYALGLGPLGLAAAGTLSAIDALLPLIAGATGNTPPAAASFASPLARLPPMTAAQAVQQFGPRS